ncbi:cytosolic sulfotransferase 15-like [Vigna umbellata]|uniref:cytosolic sulfotransferase 15-like n=1 Tax=Vigna umbellata TaxID=87088 RepID=UPI001F5FD18B|nr:cytosolic sulfotransferase 15-like [Vigna umbellata]
MDRVGPIKGRPSRPGQTSTELVFRSKIDRVSNEENELLLSLPKERGLGAAPYLHLFQDFWCPSFYFPGVNNFQKHFNGKDSDVFVASFPKSGTTWLKALTFVIINHQRFSSFEHHPLLSSNPHELVSFPEFILSHDLDDQILSLSNMSEPRLLATHLPFPSLPKSITKSNCKIIYICRNPFDTFVSAWEFFTKKSSVSSPALTFEEAFEKYCNGIMGFGPWWSHMLGYWNESITRPNKVLFLKYEDLKEDSVFHVKRMIEFLDTPVKGESTAVIENIINLCRFEKMKDLEVNKSGEIDNIAEKKNFFRKGKIGDWINYFSPSMIEKLSKIIEEKLSGSGLSFKLHS